MSQLYCYCYCCPVIPTSLMSLSIDTEKIVTVYALGEWHPVVPGSVNIDAYQLKHYQENPLARMRCEGDGRGHATDFYDMGTLYNSTQPEFESLWMNKGHDERMHRCLTPSGMAGFSFMTPEGTFKAFSLVECKAFEYEEA